MNKIEVFEFTQYPDKGEHLKEIHSWGSRRSHRFCRYGWKKIAFRVHRAKVQTSGWNIRTNSNYIIQLAIKKSNILNVV